jgi:hypothetical protein
VAVLGCERVIDRSINGIAASIFSAPTTQAGLDDERIPDE